MKHIDNGRARLRRAVTEKLVRVRRSLTLPWILLALLLSVASASAGLNVQFYFYNAIGWALTNANCTLTPYSVGLTNSGVSTLDQIPFQLDTSGQYTFTNLAAGSYTVRENGTFFVITVTNGPGTVLATNLISGLLTPGATSVYTRLQSDARYYIAPATNGFASLATNASPAPVTATAWGNTNANDIDIWLSGGTNITLFDAASNIVKGPFSITNLGYALAFPVCKGGGVTSSSISFTWHAR